MEGPDNDRWRSDLPLEALGRHAYTVVAWVDHFATWREDLRRRIEAEVVSEVDLAIGAEHVRAAAVRAQAGDGRDDMARLDRLADRLVATDPGGVPLALLDELVEVVGRYPDRRFETIWEPTLDVVVDPPHARFSAWYELFPRSTAPETGRHGTFRDVIARLPYIADLGFDVLYLPPIHPIGRTFRKGPNNTLTAGPDDPGVPWAIGAEEGGHMSVHPELGGLDDFRSLVAAAAERGIRVALDIALQASADHPYVSEHPDWFRTRPDGTIQYAENPPKKYQDIYPFDFETDAWEGLWKELARVIRFWMEQGVRIFRVDNPHTKPFAFWEWLIDGIKATDPDVLFLSEAFTRPKVMYRLAKLGFSQSYTYFTWRNDRSGLTEYLEEITRPPVSDYFRPNLFTNTPDILHAYLQEGGAPAFEVRAVLAATLAASYGIYGPPFELVEGVPIKDGSEEYLDSEKYQQRRWDLDDPRSIAPLLRRLNAIRRSHPALQSNERLWFHLAGDDRVIAYSKHSADSDDIVVVVVNLEPAAARDAKVRLPIDEFGLDRADWATIDLLGGGSTTRQGEVFETRVGGDSDVAAIFALRAAPGESGL